MQTKIEECEIITKKEKEESERNQSGEHRQIEREKKGRKSCHLWLDFNEILVCCL
jgi:hypothetical protein